MNPLDASIEITSLSGAWQIAAITVLTAGAFALFMRQLHLATWRARAEIMAAVPDDLPPEGVDDHIAFAMSWTWRNTLREWVFIGGLVLLGVLLLGAAGYVVVDAITANAPAPSNPNFADRIIASDAVLASIRLALIFAAAYVIASVAVLMYRNQWLIKAGPFEASERVAAAERANDDLEAVVTDQAEMLQALQERLAESDEILQNAVENAEEDS